MIKKLKIFYKISNFSSMSAQFVPYPPYNPEKIPIGLDAKQNPNEGLLGRGAADATQDLYARSEQITGHVRQELSNSSRQDFAYMQPNSPLDPTHPLDRYGTYFSQYLQSYGSFNIKTTANMDTSPQVISNSRSGNLPNGRISPSPDVPPNPIQGIDNRRAINANSESSHDRVPFPPQSSYGNEVAGQQSGVIGTLASIADALPAGSKSAVTPEEFKKNNLQQNPPVQPLQTATLEQSIRGKKNTAQLTSETPSQVGAGDDAKQLPTGQGAQIEAPQADTSNTQFVDAQFGQPASNSTTKSMQIGVDDNSLV
jgi:hypothetical protein